MNQPNNSLPKLGNSNSIKELLAKSKSKKADESAYKYKRVHHSEIKSASQVRIIFNENEAKEMENTMLQDGQQELVTVYPKNEEGYYIIETGERRWRALARLDMMVDIRIIPEPDKVKRIVNQFIENIKRVDLRPIEISNGIKELVDCGCSQKEIAKLLGKSASFVSKHLALQELPNDLIELAMKDKVSEVETLNNLKNIKELSIDEYNKFMELVKMGELTREMTRDGLSKLTTKVKNSNKIKEPKKLLLIKVIFEQEGKKVEGSLLLNKLPEEQDMLYVIDPKKPKKKIQVKVSEVEFVSIERITL